MFGDFTTFPEKVIIVDTHIPREYPIIIEYLGSDTVNDVLLKIEEKIGVNARVIGVFYKNKEVDLCKKFNNVRDWGDWDNHIHIFI